jgi:hypothetical protein
LSKEGGGWNYALANYMTNNNPARTLGQADPPCHEPLPPKDTPTYVNPQVDYSQVPSYASLTGTLAVNTDSFTATPGSPAWIASFITSTNAVNFVSFDARFSGVQGSRCILTVYWDTNILGQVDELIVGSDVRRYSLPFPKTDDSLLHTIGFRIDPYASAHSSVTVSNVVTGLIGLSQPFTINQTTNTSNGLKVWELVGESGYEYVLESSTNLVDWQGIATLINTNGSVRFIDPGALNSSRQFYRAVVP